MSKSNNQNKNVAIVCHSLAHYREPVFRLLSQQNAPAPVYTFFSGKQPKASSLKTIDIKKSNLLPENGGLRWKFIQNYRIGSLFWQSKMIHIALSNKFDTIIYLGDVHFLSTWVSCILSRIMGKRVLMWTHGFLSKEVGFKKLIRCSFYKLSHALLLYGNRAARICYEMGFSKDDLYVVFNSLDYNQQVLLREQIDNKVREQFRKETFDNYSWPILIATCRLTSQKKLDMLISAVGNLAQKGINVNALLVGDGPERKFLEQLSAQKNTDDRIKFWGACHDEKRLSVMISAADICVMPGEVGLTCLHAFAYGTPVITHDNADFQGPEFEAIVQGITGELFMHNDQEDLEEKIVKWLNHDLDRLKSKHACYETVNRLYNPTFQCGIINKAVTGINASVCPKGNTAIKSL